MDEQLKDKVLLTGALLMVLALGFLAGRLSVKIDNISDTPIRDVGEITTTVPTINFTALDKGILYGQHNDHALRIFVNDQPVEEKENGSFFIDTSSIKQAVTDGNLETYKFVASKNSTKYHPIGTSGANSIKPENRIYFVSREEAEHKGFTPAGDVK